MSGRFLLPSELLFLEVRQGGDGVVHVLLGGVGREVRRRSHRSLRPSRSCRSSLALEVVEGECERPRGCRATQRDAYRWRACARINRRARAGYGRTLTIIARVALRPLRSRGTYCAGLALRSGLALGQSCLGFPGCPAAREGRPSPCPTRSRRSAPSHSMSACRSSMASVTVLSTTCTEVATLRYPSMPATSSCSAATSAASELVTA